MSYLKRYFIWSGAYTVLWLALWLCTDIHITMWQVIILLVALNCYGASQRNHARWDMERQAPQPEPRTSFLPGDVVEMSITDDTFKEYDGRRGVVTYGPDNEGGWLVHSAPGNLRCVASELTMLTPREDR